MLSGKIDILHKSDAKIRRSCHLVYEKLRADISKVTPGTRLRTIRNIAKAYEVSYPTAQRAVKMLQKEGLIFSRPGSGSYIAAVLSQPKNEIDQESTRLRKSSIPREKTDGQSILAIIPEQTNQQQAASMHQYILGAVSRCKRNGWRLEIETVSLEEDGNVNFSQNIIERDFKAVLWPQVLPRDQANIVRLMDYNIDLVLGRTMPSIHADGLHEDYVDIAKKIVGYSISRGLKDIVFLGGPVEKTIWCAQDNESLDFINALKQVTKDNKVHFGQEHICQAWGLPSMEMLVTVFMQQHPQVNVIISLYYPLLQIVEKLQEKGYWENPEAVLAVDITGDILGFWDHHERKLRIGKMPCIRVEPPMYLLGQAAIMKLEQKWLNKPCDIKLDFQSKVIDPEGSVLK